MPFLPLGGQAVIEGVMMRSPTQVAVAVRRADGSLGYLERRFESITRRVRPLGLPVVRGAVSLFETLALGITALNFSAEESAREPGGKAVAAGPGMTVLQAVIVVISLVLGLVLFVILPARITSWLGLEDRLRFGLVDGGLRLLALVLYLWLISRWKEMARVLGFHGAEHKAIHALEAGAPLTPESVQTFTRFHPRCGTTFLFLVVVVSIVVFSLIGRPTSVGLHLLRVASMPLIAGIAFEFIRLSGRHFDKPFVRAPAWPGLQFQRLTTREPDLEMCAVAIASLEKVLADPALDHARRSGGSEAMSFVQ